MVGVELLGVVTPDRLVAVQHDRQGRDRGALRQQVFADPRVLVRIAGERGGGRPQPQGFVEDLGDVREPLHLLVARQDRGVGAEHAVDFLLSAGHHLGMLDQIADGKRQQTAGGLVPGDQEGFALGDDVVVAQLFPGALVHPGEHAAEQVVVILGGAAPATLVEDLADLAFHVAVVLRQLLLAPRRSFVWMGSSRLRVWLSCSTPIIASTNGCWVSR